MNQVLRPITFIASQLSTVLVGCSGREVSYCTPRLPYTVIVDMTVKGLSHRVDTTRVFVNDDGQFLTSTVARDDLLGMVSTLGVSRNSLHCFERLRDSGAWRLMRLEALPLIGIETKDTWYLWANEDLPRLAPFDWKRTRIPHGNIDLHVRIDRFIRSNANSAPD